MTKEKCGLCKQKFSLFYVVEEEEFDKWVCSRCREIITSGVYDVIMHSPSIELSEQELVDRYVLEMRKTDDNFRFLEQVPSGTSLIDFAYYNREKDMIVGIEFKKYDWRKVIYQANIVKTTFNAMYICLFEPKTKSLREHIISKVIPLGLGIIFYNTKLDQFETVLESKYIDKIRAHKITLTQTLEQYLKGEQ